MDSLELLNDALEDKMRNQMNYNDAALLIRNPSARQLMLKFRDEEMRHVEMLQKEIVAIENKPNAVTKIMTRLKS